jgi:uncharacterized protein (DUF1330 family)
VEKYSQATEHQLAQLGKSDLDAPVAALNLFWFNEHAQYQPGDPEYGTDSAKVTGQQAFAAYGAVAEAFIADGGGRVVFSTPVDQVMIGPEALNCDVVAIMFFPTRRAFLEMTNNPDFQAASRHRKAALANHHMLHLDGTPFVD